MKRLLILFLLTLVPTILRAQAWSGILAPSRAVDWSGAGVPGGIPSASWTQCGPTIAPFGSSGSYADPAPINNALNHTAAGYTGCGSNTYVLLGSGHFYLNAGVVMVSNMVLRGAGPDLTNLHFNSNTSASPGSANCGGLLGVVCFMGQNIGYNSSFAQPGQSNSATWAGTNGVTGTYTTGATSLILTNVGSAGIANGQYIYLDQADNPPPANGFLVCTIKTSSPPCSLEEGAPGRNGNTRSQAQIVKVLSGCPCSGAGPFTITIPAPGIYGLNWSSSRSPGAYFPDAGHTMKNAGIEGVTIDQTPTPPDSQPAGIAFFNTAESWVYNVRSIKAHRNHVVFFQAAHNTVLSSYIYDSQNAATQSYGIEFFISTANLVANNVFQHSTTPVVPGPATGNVIAYNFGIDNFIAQGTFNITQTQMSGCPGACVGTFTFSTVGPTAGYTSLQGGFGNGLPFSVHGLAGGTQFNCDNSPILNITGSTVSGTFQIAYPSGTNNGPTAESSVTGYLSNGTLYPFTQPHDAGVNYNLWEVNIGAELYGDVFHGSENANTFFRNYFPGYEKSKNVSSAYAVRLDSYNRYYNLIGNLFGRVGTQAIYENYTGCVSGCTPGQPIYLLGFGNTSSVTVQPDSQVRPTSMRWGNYDTAHGGTTAQFNSSEVPFGLSDGYANPVPATQTLPASFVFASQPSWYASAYATVHWPAIGPDVTGGNAIAPDMFGTTTAPNGMAYPNPAELCYLNAPIDPAYPNGFDRGVLLFNANTCYTGSPSVPFAPTGLTAASNSTNVVLNWTAPVTPPLFSSYSVYRGTVHNGPYSLIQSGVTSPTYTDTPPSGTFFYVVTAVNGSGESARSNEASAVFPATATVSLTPSTLTYAARTVGTTSPSQTATYTNTSGAGISVSISSISITGANAGDFAQTNNCPASLPSGSTCGAFPTFTPTAAGARTALLTFVDSATGSPHTITLNGTGVAATPIANLTPSNHDFGQQLLSTTSTTFAFTLSNSGTGTLSVSSVSASGDFSVLSTVPATNCGGSLTSGQSCLINVNFSPSVSGGRTGTLSVTDNASGSPHVATLSGTGITTKCQLTGATTISGAGNVCQ